MTNRIVVVVLDENERPIPGIDVVFAFSTGNQVILEGDWQWQPPHGGRLGDVVTTRVVLLRRDSLVVLQSGF
jgi:hypothetical protein